MKNTTVTVQNVIFSGKMRHFISISFPSLHFLNLSGNVCFKVNWLNLWLV